MLFTAALSVLALAGCSAAPTSSGTGGTSAPAQPSSAQPSAAQLRELLAARADAVLAGSAAGVAATQAPGAATAVGGAATSLPWAQWSYLEPVVLGSRDGLVAVRATLGFRLDGDAAATLEHVQLTVRDDGGRWRVVSERTDGAGAAVWELGDVDWAGGDGVSVVSVGGAGSARTLLAAAEQAQRAVTRWWPSSSTGQPVVVVVPGSDELARGLGRTPASLDGLGAVTVTGPAIDGHAASRVWLARDVVRGLDPGELQVLLRHELLHAASGSPGRAGVPLWLSEGVAEQAGWQAVRVGPQVWARDLLAAVRRDGAPAGLPADADFSGAGLRAAYAGAHLAAEVLDEGSGRGAARDVLRRVLDGEDLDSALRSVSGTGIERLVKRWRERAGSLAAGAAGTIEP